MNQTAKLGDVAEVMAGVGFPKDMQGRAGGDIPVFKVGDISTAWTAGERMLLASRNYLTADEALKLGRLVPAGSTVFAKIGEALRLNRRAVLGQPSLVDNNVMGLVPRVGTLAPMYLFYFMQTVDLGKLSRATAVPSIRKSDVVEIAIPLPSLDEQARVVAEIEKQFSRLDEAVASLKRVKANLKRYKAAVLKAAVQGRLVPSEAELVRREGRGYETGEGLLQRILQSRREGWKGNGKYKEPAAADAGFGEVPEGWVCASVDQLLAHVTDGDHQPPPQTASGIPFLVIGDVRSGKIDFSDTRFVSADYYRSLDPLRRPQEGDVLYTLVGSYGIPVRVATSKAFCVQRHMAILRPHSLSPMEYLAVAMSSEFVFRQATEVATGTAQLTVPLAGLRRIAVPLPPTREQERIVAEVDRRLSIVREVEAEVDANLKRAASLRSSCLAASFSAAPTRARPEQLEMREKASA